MPPRRAPHVVVVGGGAAGLAAAARLCGRGVAVTLLEARERLGGRVDTRVDPVLGLAVERGAEFVHGRPETTLALARRARAEVREVPDRHLLLHRGRRADATATFARGQALLALGDRPRRGGAATDAPFAALLRRERGPRRDGAAALALEFVRGFYLADPGAASSRALAAMNRAMEELGGDVTSRVEGGYARVLSPLTRALAGAGATVRLGAAATRIRWRPGEVVVEARGLAGGRLPPVAATHAIVTVPLPMLQDGSLELSPPLAEKRRAAKALTMGPIVKVLLRFRRPPWRASRRRPLVFLHVPRAPVPVFWTLAPLDAPVLVGWAGGPHGARLAGRRADEVLRAALASLARGLGRAAVELEERLDGADVVDWTRDPLARGGYAVFPAGSWGASEALARSVADTLFFAGEATAGAHAGTVEGALRSGERAAGEVLAALEPR